MLDRELVVGNISGAKASARSSALKHPIYANDIVLFSKATRNDACHSSSKFYVLWILHKTQRLERI